MEIKTIEQKVLNKEELENEEVETILKYIVASVRNIVSDQKFINKCDLVQGLIGRYLNKLGIANYPCITNKCVMPNVVGHSFIIANISNKNYIIDPSFVQFMHLNSDYDDLYINNFRIKSKSPYYYASKIDADMTSCLLEKGYLELNEESAYLYGNAFYRTMTNIPINYPFNNIDGQIFINSFLKGKETLRKYDYDEIEFSVKKSK